MTLALWLALTIPLIIVLFFLVGRIQFFVLRKTYNAINTMTSFFAEHVSAMKHVKTQNIEEAETASGYEAIDARYRADIWATFMTELQVLLHSVYTRTQTVIIALGGSSLIRQGKLEQTGINTFSTYTEAVNKYMAENLTHYQNFKGTQGALDHVNSLLNLKDENLEKGENAGEHLQGDLIFDDVRFSFDGEYDVLKGVSLKIPRGSITAIIGNNGCGKSTVVKLLQGFYRPSSGRILMGGTDISEIKLKEWRRQFGYVQQDSPLFSDTIRDNILYGTSMDIPDEKILEAAERAHVTDFITDLKEGFDTRIGEAGSKISGGQRQRIALARALIMEPEFLILDESAASLDHETASGVFDEVLRNKKPEQTIIIISHNMDEVKRADQLISMKDGMVVGSGPADVMRKTDQIYLEYEKIQNGGAVQ